MSALPECLCTAVLQLTNGMLMEVHTFKYFDLVVAKGCTICCACESPNPGVCGEVR